MNINIAISANSRFLNKTYKKSVKSIIDSGIPVNNIFIFLGNDNTEKIDSSLLQNPYNVKIIFLTKNYFENNSFIGLLENNLDVCDYWFVMHDTCVAGENFASRLLAYDYTNKECVSLFVGGCGSIGAYRYNIIKKYENYFKTLTTLDNTNQNLIKDKCIEMEDHIFQQFNFKHYYSHSAIITKEEYLPGVFRRKEKSEYLDFSKFKANYVGRRSNYIISDLL